MPKPAMAVEESTRQYEVWLSLQTRIIRADLRRKHELMAKGPFEFLRATFYRWTQLWPEACRELTQAPRVQSVGDLHIENFGTWRDVDGRLIWGVNDFDEACRLPWTNDLVRLATSALLAIESEHLALRPRRACDAMVEGYRDALRGGGRPFVLAEHHNWLREIAVEQLAAPQKFWKRMEQWPTVRRNTVQATTRRLLESMLPENIEYRIVRRQAGLGSRGHERLVALADWRGGKLAREAKALAPSAVAWTGRSGANPIHSAAVIAHAVRVPDPLYRIDGSWVLRRLAPDCHKINLADLPRKRDEERMVYSMGWETANIHLGSSSRVDLILRDPQTRKGDWLFTAAQQMAKLIIRDWKQWRNSW